MTDRMDKALRHIETAVDVDEWAMQTARECFEKLDKIKQVVDAWKTDKAWSSYDCMDNIDHIFNGEAYQLEYEPTTKNDLSSGLEKNSKKLEKETDYTWEDVSSVMDAMEYRTNSLIENIKSEILHFANAHCSGDDINIYDAIKVIDDCCEAENSTTKNDLGVDCISREAVERIINKWLSHSDYELKDHIYSMTEKIHNLPSVTPQEPFINKPCVSEKMCEHDKQMILDKIRAEIEKWHREGTNWSDIRLMEIEDILDKDKAESEPQESEE